MIVDLYVSDLATKVVLVIVLSCIAALFLKIGIKELKKVLKRGN